MSEADKILSPPDINIPQALIFWQTGNCFFYISKMQ